METQFELVGHKGDVTRSQNQVVGKARGVASLVQTESETPKPHGLLLGVSAASFSPASPLHRPAYYPQAAPGLSLPRTTCGEGLSFPGSKFSRDVDWPRLGHVPVPVGGGIL